VHREPQAAEHQRQQQALEHYTHDGLILVSEDDDPALVPGWRKSDVPLTRPAGATV
jgi:hypothetical protein